jgi:hypothetical protein
MNSIQPLPPAPSWTRVTWHIQRGVMIAGDKTVVFA